MVKLSTKTWFAIIIFSFFGQVAWIVENMYFNVFIFQEFNATPSDIALMVASSAIAATLTTLLMGALSDKIGKRKLFISVGYVFWGFSIIGFALLNKNTLGSLFPYANSISLGITLVITFDCIMTFFGSTANDANFNAWLTDITHESNRGRVEGVIASMPLIALLAVFGGFMGLTANKAWSLIFIIIGSFVIFAGVIGFFLIQEGNITVKNESYFKNIIYGFRPSVIKENKTLYLILLGSTILGISLQVFMPYLILFYQYRLNLDNYVFIFAPAIILASIASIIYGRLLDQYKFQKVILPALVIFIGGLVLLYFSSNLVVVFTGTLLMLIGNLTIGASFGAITRDYTPKDQVGLFQGLRIFATVLIPMVIGPIIGSTVINSSEPITLGDGTVSQIPTHEMFLASIAVILFLFIVLYFILKSIYEKKNPNHSL